MTTQDLRPSDIIYRAGYDTGHLLGRIATLRLVYIGAACAYEVDCAIVTRHTERIGTLGDDHFACAGFEYMRDKRIGRALANVATAEASLGALAALGDETAIDLMEAP